MVLVSDVLDHIGRIYSPLNLANMKNSKLKFVQNNAPDKQRVLNFMRNPDLDIFLLYIWLGELNHETPLVQPIWLLVTSHGLSQGQQ